MFALLSSVPADANLDMLHQLIEEIEIDRKAVMSGDSLDPALSRRTFSSTDHLGLDSIPETSTLNFNASADGAGEDQTLAANGVDTEDLVDSNEQFTIELGDDKVDGRSKRTADDRIFVDEENGGSRSSISKLICVSRVAAIS